MTATTKKRKQDAKDEFFLYVAFHAAFSALVNLFKDND